jgi:hypothetical protein
VFIETSEKRVELSSKQMCAIESAALNNPNALVKVYTLNAGINDQYLLMQNYENIQLNRIDEDNEFRFSFIHDWWTKVGKQQLKNSEHHVAHFSDLLRIWYLWKHGHFYSDLDTIMIKSVKSLLKYPGIGYMPEGGPSLGNGVLVFPAGSKLLLRALQEFISTYKRVLRAYCNVTDIYASLAFDTNRTLLTDDKDDLPLSNTKTATMNAANEQQQTSSTPSSTSAAVACNATIFPQSYFYSYPYSILDSLFNKNQCIPIQRVMDAYTVHFYGKLSEKRSVAPRDFSVYDFLAKFNCPFVYSRVEDQHSFNKSAQFIS